MLSLHVLCVAFNFYLIGVSSENVNFMLIGDWGGMPQNPYVTNIQKAVAERLGEVSKEINAAFVMALGDNFYFDGVTNITDKRFIETYENVYSHSSLQIPWYVLAGNHDHHGNVTAEVAYTKKSHRWRFPDLCYTFSYAIPGTNSVIDVIMIDTVVLCGNTDTFYVGEPPLGPKDPQKANDILKWLEAKLANSKADYLIVAGHYPVISIAEHGPTKCLLGKFKQMLEKYNVTAYMSGHDHNLQHLKHNNIEYILVGAGAYIVPSKKHKHSVPRDSSIFYWADEYSLGGFGTVEANSTQILIKYRMASGKIIHQVSIPPRKFRNEP